MNKLTECPNCSDPNYISKKAYILYSDKKSPKWSCLRCIDEYRKHFVITHPDALKNIGRMIKKDNDE